MSRPPVCILQPILKRTNPLTEFCLLASKRDGDIYENLPNEPDIATARNILADFFLNETNLEWCLWIDDDMVWPIGKAEWYNTRLQSSFIDQFAGLDAFSRLFVHKRDIVSGVYFGRGLGAPAMFHESIIGDPIRNEMYYGPVNQTFEAKWAATGFLLVNRKVFESIKMKFPELAPKEGERYWKFFTPNEDHLGEDQIFGIRAQEAGHYTCIDRALYLGHIGRRIWSSHNCKQQ